MAEDYLITLAMAAGAGALLYALAWESGVLVSWGLRRGDLPPDMPGWVKGATVLVSAVAGIAALASIHATRDDQGQVMLLGSWVIVCLGVTAALYGGPRRDMWLRGNWTKRQAAILTFIVFGIGLPFVFVDVSSAFRDDDDIVINPPQRAVVLTVEPWHERTAVGITMPFALKVTNDSGSSLKNLDINLAPGQGYALETEQSLTFESLQDGESWGEVFLPVVFQKPGFQSLEFRLSYEVGDKGQRMAKIISWDETITGPELEIKRRLFVNDHVRVGEGLHVGLSVRNVGIVPALDLFVDADLGSHFEVTAYPNIPSTLDAGQEVLLTYQAISVAPGKARFADNITFSDLAGNDYDSSDLRVENYICRNARDCNVLDGIEIKPPSFDAETPSVLGRPINLSVDQLELKVQVRPGFWAPKEVTIRHDGDDTINVRVQPVGEDRGLLVGYDTTIAVPPNADASISGTVSVDAGTALGVYEPALELQVVGQNGRPIGALRRVPIRVEVTPVQVEHSVSSLELIETNEAVITTNVTNYSDLHAQIILSEYFPRGGMTVIGDITAPIGEPGGAEGDFYIRKLALGPGQSAQRIFRATASADVDRTIPLEARISFKLSDGTAGSASHTVWFVTAAPGD